MDGLVVDLESLAQVKIDPVAYRAMPALDQAAG
jgi:hypothetical protein